MKTKRLTFLSATMFALALFTVLHYIWGDAFIAELNADTTDTILWAAASLDSGAIASHTFHYGYFIPSGGNLCFLPFLPAFGLGLTSLRCGMSLFVAIFAFAVWNLFRSFGWKAHESLCSTSMLLCALLTTAKLREIYFGHVLYYSLGTLFLFLAASTFSKWRRNWIGHVLFGLCLAWAASAGTPILLYATVPLLAALSIDQLFGKCERKECREAAARITAGIVGTILGLVIYKLLSKGIFCPYADKYSLYAPARAWWNNFCKLLISWITLLCDLPNARIPVLSPRGLVYAMQILAAIGLAIAQVCAVIKSPGLQRNERLFILAHSIMAGATLFFWVFGNISDANWRLCPALVSSMAVMAIVVRSLLNDNSIGLHRFGALTVAALFFSIVASVILAMRTAPRSEDVWRSPDSLLSVLERERVDYGYCADFWLANPITVISNGRIPLRTVCLANNRWAQRKFQTDDRWYDSNPQRRRTALVCRPNLSQYVPTNGLINRVGCRQADVHNRTYVNFDIFIYDGDFPEKIAH